jgi:hypothetical protein
VLLRAESIDAHWGADGDLLGIATSRTQQEKDIDSGLFQRFKGLVSTVEYEPADKNISHSAVTTEFKGVRPISADYGIDLSFNTTDRGDGQSPVSNFTLRVVDAVKADMKTRSPDHQPPDYPPPDYPVS